MTPVILPWLAEIAIITWRSMTGTHFAISGGGKAGGVTLPGKITKVQGVKRPPLPSELLVTFIAFGVYSAIAEKDARIGQLLAWGTVLATGLMMFGGKGPEAEQINSRQNFNPLTQTGAVQAQTPQNPNPYASYYPYPQGSTGQGGF